MSLDRLLRTSGFRFAALAAAVLAGCFGLLLGAIYWSTSDVLDQQFRNAVAAEAGALAANREEEGLDELAADIATRTNDARSTSGFYLLLDATGKKLAGNVFVTQKTDGWQELPHGVITDASTIPADEVTDHQILGLGQTFPDGSYLFVGDDVFRIAEAQEAIIAASAWAGGIALFLALAGGLFISQRFLNRIDLINATSRAIMEGNLRERIPVRGTLDELDKLSANLNAMLDRIQALMDNLKQVSSSIAHDLRTPLSRMRHNLESTYTFAGRSSEFRAGLQQAMAEADALLATFSALLRISEIESGTRRSAFKAVSLSATLQRVADAYGAVIEDSGRRFGSSIAPGLTTNGDEELLVQMFANLIENATRHTPPGSNIELRLDGTSAGVEVIVADDGPGVPETERARVMERFYRLDRSRTSSGSGLGLALVAAVIELHGWVIELADNAPGLKVVIGCKSIAIDPGPAISSKTPEPLFAARV